MKLYRIVHKEVAASLTNPPHGGCSLFRGKPYLYAFDSPAAACLENPIYKAINAIPKTFLLVEYCFPVDSVSWIELDLNEIYGDRNSNDYLSPWIESFLNDNLTLIAKFPSKNWASAQICNYVVNPKHSLFHKALISESYSLDEF